MHLLLFTTLVATATNEPVTSGLVAFIDFGEVYEGYAFDQTENGHHAKLRDMEVGDDWVATDSDVAWANIADDPGLRGATFTWDLWFELSGGAMGRRIITQTSGTDGPEIFTYYWSSLAFRITNKRTELNSPNVGDVHEGEDGADHWAYTESDAHTGSALEHLIFAHDAGHRRVRMYLGLLGQPLHLVYDGTYSGSYRAGDRGIFLGNNHRADRVSSSRFYQFAYYDRVLSGTERAQNHAAGPHAQLPKPDPTVPPAVEDDDFPYDDPAEPYHLPPLEVGEESPLPSEPPFELRDPGPDELVWEGGCAATRAASPLLFLLLIVRRRRR